MGEVVQFPNERYLCCEECDGFAFFITADLVICAACGNTGPVDKLMEALEDEG